MSNSTVSAEQIRAARALLGISASELAELAAVGWATIQRYETGSGLPKARPGSLDRVREALEREGIEFIGDPLMSPGVRLNRTGSSRVQPSPTLIDQPSLPV